MKKEMIVLALLGCGLTSTGFASHTIDGSLYDWGVTPFVNWAPTGSADYIETDNVNLYNTGGYRELYDFEALYFDDDPTHFYFGVVGSYSIGFDPATGDIGIDLNHDMAIAPHGATTGLEYAVQIASGPLGQVLHNPIWSPTDAHGWSDGPDGSPYQASGGTVVGSASVAIEYYPDMEYGTYILEAAIPRSILAGYGGDIGDLVGAHISLLCGNDSINLTGDIDTHCPPVVQPPIPAPGAMVLGGLGIGLVGWLRRHRTV